MQDNETCRDTRILHMVTAMETGYSRRTDCPECGGTRCALVSKKSSTTGFVHCFRPSCQYSRPVQLPEQNFHACIERMKQLKNSEADKPRLPKDMTALGFIDSHHPAWAWVSLAGLHANDIYGLIYWSDSLRSVVIPCMREGYLQGVLYRPMPTVKGRPKYVLSWAGRALGVIWAPHGDYRIGQAVWVVEDVLSCLRLRKLGLYAIASLGTYCNNELMGRLLELQPKRIIPFLDGDKAGAKGMFRFKRQCELHGIPCYPECVPGKDPKHLTDTELSEVIQGVQCRWT